MPDDFLVFTGFDGGCYFSLHLPPLSWKQKSRSSLPPRLPVWILPTPASFCFYTFEFLFLSGLLLLTTAFSSVTFFSPVEQLRKAGAFGFM